MPKLEIELVPSSSWFDNVRTRVSTSDWKRCKQYAAQRSKNRCQICGGRGPRWPVECHERWEYDDDRHIQTLVGLIALCPRCHEAKHIGLASQRGRLVYALSHLAEVNGWTAEDAGLYVEWAFELWSIRSQHPWMVDVSWLGTIGITEWATETTEAAEALKNKVP
jgi:hypothetical protein